MGVSLSEKPAAPGFRTALPHYLPMLHFPLCPSHSAPLPHPSTPLLADPKPLCQYADSDRSGEEGKGPASNGSGRGGASCRSRPVRSQASLSLAGVGGRGS